MTSWDIILDAGIPGVFGTQIKLQEKMRSPTKCSCWNHHLKKLTVGSAAKGRSSKPPLFWVYMLFSGCPASCENLPKSWNKIFRHIEIDFINDTCRHPCRSPSIGVCIRVQIPFSDLASFTADE